MVDYVQVFWFEQVEQDKMNKFSHVLLCLQLLQKVVLNFLPVLGYCLPVCYSSKH